MNQSTAVEYDIVLPETNTTTPLSGINPKTLQKMQLAMHELTALREALERGRATPELTRVRSKRNTRNRIAKASRKRNR